jgi:hypothetical protein
VRLADFLARADAMPVDVLMAKAHAERAAGTRGAAAGLLALGADGRGEFVGVGNVEPLAFGGATQLVTRPGTVGLALPALTLEPVHVPPGAGIALHSDGLRSRLRGVVPADVARLSAPLLLGVILATAERRKDDAAVLVVRRAP